ncbi:ribonuclease activity regulator RraA [Sandaracinobacteroides saxicola]|uniref:Ribonuclease activity regulator RraA n=1 Tax=Sandaracinobacteroides saxicola TaxID=2759707 RepID=A0A7G5IMJ2_9SPHN|nr:ribonuclease activity regulator RraA [Sandaracinobacteroides saxicola]
MPYRRIDELTRAKLKTISTATVATILHARGLRNQFIQGVFRLTEHRRPMVGQAFTLRHIPAREDIDQREIFRDPKHPQRVGVESVGPGDVFVMDCHRDPTSASLGGILASRLQSRGCEGFVSDAGIRDSDYAATLDLPIYVASRSAPTNLTRQHGVELNVPIGCGGVPVYPGDVMLGDGDGVMVIPLEYVDDILPEALRMEHYESFAQAHILAGAKVTDFYPAKEEALRLYAAYKAQNPMPFGEE